MRFPLLGSWEDAETGVVLIERLFVARTFWQRFRGLQFARPLERDCGLLLRNCRSVHTMSMRFAIDLVFLSDDLEVLEVQTDVQPWRIALPKEKRAAHLIEVTAGQHRHLSKGMKTRLTPIEQMLVTSSTGP